MRFLYIFFALFTASLLSAQDIKNSQVAVASIEETTEPTIGSDAEPHLKNMKQLTFGGDNAEAYFSFDGKKLSFQSNNPLWNLKCDQIFNLDIEKAGNDSLYKPTQISSGQGRTTCSYFMKDNKQHKTINYIYKHRTSANLSG